MNKVKLGARPYLYPMPIVLVGANVNGKPNFLTAAFVGIANYKPAMIAVGLGKHHYTNSGIKKNKTFSVNIPSQAMVKAVDFCGIYSGHKVDKSELFQTFSGKLKTAPMIAECPISMECKLIRSIPLGIDELFLAKIVEVYADKKCLTPPGRGEPDLRKIQPLLFTMPDNKYWKIGKFCGPAWKIGKGFKPGKQSKMKI